MRHKKNKWKLSKTSDQRVSLVRNQTAALFEHGYLNTTLPRAKAVQAHAEKLITKAKRGDLNSIRQCARHLPDKTALRHLLRQVAPAQGSITSGFTQIARLKYRRGDGTLIVRLSLREFAPQEEAAK